MNDAPATATERLIHELEVAQCVPVTQLRAHMTAMAKKLIAHLRQQDETITILRRGQ